MRVPELHKSLSWKPRSEGRSRGERQSGAGGGAGPGKEGALLVAEAARAMNAFAPDGSFLDQEMAAQARAQAQSQDQDPGVPLFNSCSLTTLLHTG